MYRVLLTFDCTFYSPVHIAATVGSVEGLELLLSYNGDMNALSFQNITPVHDAAANGKTG